MSPALNAPAPAYLLEDRARTWSDWRRTAGLVKHLTRRHLAARYRGSVLGFFWSLLNPLMMMGVYTLVFQYIFRLSSPGVPYPVFFLTGLLAWNFVQTATTNAAVSVIEHWPLIHQAYFPRITLPISTVLSNLFNYVVSIPILIVFCWLFGIAPGPTLLLLPLVLLLLLLLAMALGLIAACLTPFFRDLVQLLDVIFVAWFFATPVLYPASMARTNLPDGVYSLFQFNPALGAIGLVRTVFLGEPVSWPALGVSLVGTVILLAVGVALFNRLASRFPSAI